MNRDRTSPDPGRVSVATVAVLLAYALTHIIRTPALPVEFTIVGIVLDFDLNINLAFAVLAAGLAASGMDWLVRDHPSLENKRTLQHWLLPLLTALVIGVALSTLPSNWIWWIGFGLGACVLVIVYLAEYTAVDPTAISYPLASMTLIAFSYVLFLILATALGAAGVRLLLMIPALALAAFLTALRTLYLRLGDRWEVGWAGGIALVCSQLAAALHYWPLTPVQFGLFMLGPLYALSSLTVNIIDEIPLRRAVIEPVVILGLLWASVFWFR